MAHAIIAADAMDLPVDEILPQLRESLRNQPCAVLQAPPGAGKTTRVPPALLDAGLAGDRAVVVLEPRRLAARAAAHRVAAERGGDLGSEVGYQVRFDRRAGDRTRLLFVTEGILLRMLQEDPFLERFGAIVFDEVHERNLSGDLAMAMANRIRTESRPDLRLVAMSATLETDLFARFFGDCPVLHCQGRMHEVAIEYDQRPEPFRVAEASARAATRLLGKTDGDLLVFLPGVGEIRRTAGLLEGPFDVVELYGDLPLDRQDAALRPGPRRRVVLATNVAETSVTVEGVTGVVDSGLARVLQHDPGVGLARLELTRISRASAAQRTGRAGRMAPGVCLRLWSEHDERQLAEREPPEIRRLDLAGAVLELLYWGERDPAAFPWLEAPEPERLDRALSLLQRLGAVQEGALTSIGRKMARLPVQPRLARLLIDGGRRAALLAALLSEREPFTPGEAAHTSDSDLLDRVEALEAFERHGTTRSPLGEVHRQRARFVLRLRDQLARGSRRESDEELLRAIVAAYPDRVARRRADGDRRALMVGGKGVRLDPRSAVTDAGMFACIEVDGRGADARVRLASRVEREWLPAALLSTEDEVEFDESAQRVVALRRMRYMDLVIDETRAPSPDPGLAAELLAHHAARLLKLDDFDDGGFVARVRSLREWMPELGLPAFDEHDFAVLLPALCRGRRSIGELRKAPLLAALKARLEHHQLRAVEQHAPERITVPSGSRIQVRYEPGQRPVLAVRIQELFGLAETPRIASGRVKLLLHLLAPNGRPQQVTDDLESFWANTYAQVRKELRARYPKHAWPEDPRKADPQRRPRRRR